MTIYGITYVSNKSGALLPIYFITMILKLLSEQKIEEYELLLSLTHDVKTPLSTILLSARALQKQFYPDEKQRQQVYSQIINKSQEIQKYVD